MLETLLGGVFGGVLRLAPEVFKIFDAKDSRKHELAMMSAEMEFAKIKGEMQLKETEATLTIAELDAMKEAFKEQASTAGKSYKWVAAVSGLVRPLVTYWFVGVYSATKVAAYTIATSQGGIWNKVLISMWGKEDMAILNLLLTFYFVGRVYDRKS